MNTICGSDTLSSHIRDALRQRSEDEPMFVLLAPQPYLSDAHALAGGPPGVAETVVTKRIWCRFVCLLQQRHAESCGGEASRSGRSAEAPSPRHAPCDVGLYCSESFHACLVESACLFLGLSFCLFRPDDAPLRLARLEQRRQPRHRLRAQDIESMLDEACSQGGQDSTAASLPVQVANVLPSLASPSDGDTAYFMFTSGSTGEPKCVVASRGNLRAYLENFIRSAAGLAICAGRPSRVFCLSSPFFDPSIGDMLAALCTPQCTFFTCRADSVVDGCVGALVAAARPTHVVTTPAVWATIDSASLHRAWAPAGAAAHPLFRLFVGGEKMSQALIDAWADKAELFNIYGVTEATIYQSVRRVLPGTRAEDVTCGSGVGTRIAIEPASRAAHVDSAEDTDADGHGEVVLYGAQVCCGYAEDTDDSDPPRTTTSSSSSSSSSEQGARSPFGVDVASGVRFFRTGDMGRLLGTREGGAQLVLRGRRDWQLKLNGQRVSLEEVEGTVQRALAGLCTQCACFCVSATTSPALIAAAVVLADVASAETVATHSSSLTEALKEVVAFHLPPFMIPRRWLLFPSSSPLPRTPTGKVSRAELALRVQAAAMAEEEGEEERGVASDRAGPASADAPPPLPPLFDGLHTVVHALWERHLGVSVRPNTHYLHAGGDSLGALKLTRAIYLGLQTGNGEDGIDEYGGLPHPFGPCVLLQHPRFADYVATLRQALGAGVDGVLHEDSAAMRGVVDDSGDSASSSRPPPGQLPSLRATAGTAAAALRTSPLDVVFSDVVATRCCGLAERLLEHRLVDVNGGNTREHRCVTPLHVAVSSCDVESTAEQVGAAAAMVDLLLRCGAKATAVTPDGVTPAHLAAASSAVLLRCLLEAAPALVHCRDGRQQSLLHFAARSGNVASVRLLLYSYQLRLDTRDKWQRTAVHWAALNGHGSVLEVMLTYYRTTTEERGAQRTAEVSGAKRQRQQEKEAARLVRLARKKTHLAYETLLTIAQRTSPGDERVAELCRALSDAVGEDASPSCSCEENR